jgi:uncharacterized membrane protein HdeD (DUF308 family)
MRSGEMPTVRSTTFARKWKSLALRGVAALWLGFMALFWPNMPLTALVLIVAIYALVDGVLVLGMATTKHASRHITWALILQGTTGIALGIAVLLWPAMPVRVLGHLVALWAIISGLFQVFTAVHLRRELPRELTLGLAGAATVVLGLAILVWPTAGGLPLVLLCGSYAFVFATAMLAQALRLRRYLHGLEGEDRALIHRHPRAWS